MDWHCIPKQDYTGRASPALTTSTIAARTMPCGSVNCSESIDLLDDKCSTDPMQVTVGNVHEKVPIAIFLGPPLKLMTPIPPTPPYFSRLYLWTLVGCPFPPACPLTPVFGRSFLPRIWSKYALKEMDFRRQTRNRLSNCGGCFSRFVSILVLPKL